MKIELIPVTKNSKGDFLPACEKSVLVTTWLEKRYLSKRDRDFLSELGFDVVIVNRKS